jgi:hypothetical protein
MVPLRSNDPAAGVLASHTAGLPRRTTPLYWAAWKCFFLFYATFEASTRREAILTRFNATYRPIS